ncbi:MAG: hypothetical protein N3A69_07955, partial [Leptospiraceae bacterium]|nr:hypothetical protein [Leptospiraceae bacterium]
MKRIFLIFVIFLTLSFCNQIKVSNQGLLENLGLLSSRSSRVTLSGTVIKGVVRNAISEVVPLSANGECNKDLSLAKGTTNDLGYYSLSFPRTGSAVCIIIRPAENGKTTVYDEKSGKDLPLLNTSKFRMVMVYPESKIGGNSRKTLFVSPFSRIVAKRVQFLTKQNPGTSIERLHTRASKELVIRFGLNQGLNVKKHVTFQKKSQSVSEEEVPELDDLLVELENPSSAVTAKFVSVLVGISHLASKYKNGGEVSLDDLDEVIEAFAADFADGTFDGKTPDGQSITIGSGANQITFSSDPLGDVLLPAIANYIAEGGTLSV